MSTGTDMTTTGTTVDFLDVYCRCLMQIYPRPRSEGAVRVISIAKF